MHEWALAEAVIQTALNAAKREGLKKIKIIKISLGELQDIEQEIFNSAISELMKMHKSLFDHTKIEIRVVKTKFRCRACKYEWMLEDATLDDDIRESIHFIPEVAHSFIRCPSCNSPDFEIVEGRGVSITSIVGEK